MKNFEKWAKDNFEEVHCWECGGIGNDDLAAVWRAALEWVLYEDEHEGWKEAIEEELENE